MMENVNDKNRKLIKALELIGDYELMKPIDKIDGDVIDATVNWSLRLQNKDISLSTEEIEKMVSMIPFDETEELNETNGEAPNQIKVLKKNKVLFIAAIITILVTLLTIVSVAFEWNIFEELKNRFGTVADTPVNEEIVVDGETVIMLGDGEIYTKISDLLKLKNCEIMYPNYLPRDTKIKRIIFYEESYYEKLSLITTDEKLTIEITFDSNLPSEVKESSEYIETINGLTCYIIEMNDIRYAQIHFELGDNWYLLSGEEKQELIEIIKNLKELE